MEVFGSRSGKTMGVRIPKDKISSVFYSPFDLYFSTEGVTETFLKELVSLEYDRQISKKLKKLAETHRIDLHQETHYRSLLYPKEEGSGIVSFPYEFRENLYNTLLEKEGGYPKLLSIIPHIQGLKEDSQYYLIANLEDSQEDVAKEVKALQDFQAEATRLKRVLLVVKTCPNEIMVFMPKLEQPLSLDPQILIDYIQISEILGQP